MSDVRCTTCAAWQPQNDDERMGECRRRAPRPADPRGVTRRVWPSTGWADWCLDFERRVRIEGDGA